jgi:predicted polyphosphate/ATP-dependent NAD kinase
MIKKVGLIVNPIAGMGGSVGLKGTDGAMALKARQLGARPVAPARTQEYLSHLKHRDQITLTVAPGPMGEAYTDGHDIDVVVVGTTATETTREDTANIATEMLERGIDLLSFVGGDGTARDIYDAIGLKCPVVGVPSGVKVYSSVFALNPRAAAAMVDRFIEGAEVCEQEVLDIDEDAFRRNILDARLYGYMLVPADEQLLQGGKEGSSQGASNIENQNEIAEYVAEILQDGTLYLLGPGTTVNAIAKAVGVEKTLLGIDAIHNGKLIASDLNENSLLDLIGRYGQVEIIVTPLGGNGFIFGRGNRQFTARILRLTGKKNIMIVATRDKLRKLKCLRVDTGDYELDQELSGYIDVIVGYKYSKVFRVEC